MTDERDDQRLETDEEQDVEGHRALKGRALKGETDETTEDEVEGHMGLQGRALRGRTLRG
jgi:hypothetical protein